MRHLLILTPLVVFFLSGCTRTVYVDRKVEVAVPVKCTVQDADCPHLADLNDSAAVDEMGRCVLQMRENERACQR